MREPGQVDAPIDVLVCDDIAAIRALLGATMALRPNLRLVGEASTGEEVIAEARRLQPHVILLDLSMPDMSGFDALPHLRRVAPNTRVIVLSGFAAQSMEADALARGASRHLEKGATPDETNATIEAVAAAAPAPAPAGPA